MDLFWSFSLLILTIVIRVIFDFLPMCINSLKIRKLFGIKPSSEFLEEAGVAGKLVPRLKPFITGKSHITIVGHDGTYANKTKGKYWLKNLSAWADKGAVINHILMCPDSECVENFRSLAKTHPENFILHEISDEISDHKHIEKLRHKFMTTHPTLVETELATQSKERVTQSKERVTQSKERVMWLEGRHPKNSEYAYDIEFLTPEQANTDERYDRLQNEIEIITSSHLCTKYIP